MKLDSFDIAILSKLTKNARSSVNEIAEEVALSPSAVSRRLSALERGGAIRSYTALLDGNAIGLPLTVFVDIRLKTMGDDELSKFEAVVTTLPNVIDCHLMSGDVDYMMRVRAKDMAHYEEFFRKHLSTLPGVERITTRFGMRSLNIEGGIS